MSISVDSNEEIKVAHRPSAGLVLVRSPETQPTSIKAQEEKRINILFKA